MMFRYLTTAIECRQSLLLNKSIESLNEHLFSIGQGQEELPSFDLLACTHYDGIFSARILGEGRESRRLSPWRLIRQGLRENCLAILGKSDFGHTEQDEVKQAPSHSSFVLSVST